MTTENTVQLVCVGSIALDTIKTPSTTQDEVLGGSASYASAAASFFSKTGMVGVVGTDFSEGDIKLFKDFGIDVAGLERADGETFRWSGEYEADMNQRRTITTKLNVFGKFSPNLPKAYRTSPFLFLANIGPDLQLKVLDQMEGVRFCAADTMDLWINTTRETLDKLISKINLLLINESEARKLTGNSNMIKAGKTLLSQGPDYILIKKGEYGSMLCSKNDIFLLPAYPVVEVTDPTGAGDAFAGGLMGYLAEASTVTSEHLFQAMGVATVMASFAIESFSLERLRDTSRKEITGRLERFKKMSSLLSQRE